MWLDDHPLAGESAQYVVAHLAFLQAATDEQARTLIAVGIPGSQMSAYSLDHGGPLTSEQIKALATFIRSWEDDAPDVPNWRNPLES